MSGNSDFQKKTDLIIEGAKKHEAALKDARSISNIMDGWRIGGGELARMPIQQKLELAKRCDLRISSV